MKRLHDQYRHRNMGENGISRLLTILINNLDVWQQKLLTQLHNENSGKAGKIKLSENEWTSFYQAIDDWLEIVAKAQGLVGMPG